MKIVAFVPIRLNSKRVPGKNLRMLNGKPLMNYIFETLTEVKYINDVYCFCSDESVRTLLPQGIKFLKRDESLDSDSTLGKDIYESFIRQVDADVYVLCHATSPFIKGDTISNAIRKVVDENFDSSFSAEKMQTFAWYDGKPLNYDLKLIPRTQDIEPVFIETSAFFIFKRTVWTGLHQRIGNHPYIAVVDKLEGIDIDWPEDFVFAEKVLQTLNND